MRVSVRGMVEVRAPMAMQDGGETSLNVTGHQYAVYRTGLAGRFL